MEDAAERKFDFLEWVAHRVESRGFITVFALTVGACAAFLIWKLDPEARTPGGIAAIVQTAAVLVGLLSLILIAKQIRATAAQAANAAAISQSLAYHQFFGDLVTVEVHEKIRKAAAECGFADARKKGEPMSPAAVACIKENETHDAVVACYLDEFEEFCGAIHAGLLDADYAYGLEATRVIRTWKVFEPYVVACRGETGDHRTYLELETVAATWTDKRAKDGLQQTRKNHGDHGIKKKIH